MGLGAKQQTVATVTIRANAPNWIKLELLSIDVIPLFVIVFLANA